MQSSDSREDREVRCRKDKAIDEQSVNCRVRHARCRAANNRKLCLCPSKMRRGVGVLDWRTKWIVDRFIRVMKRVEEQT